MSSGTRDIEDETKFKFTRTVVTLGQDLKGRKITSCTVTVEPTKGAAGSTWPSSLNLFHECLLAAIEEHGEEYRVPGKAEIFVRATNVDTVRALHKDRYVHTGDKEPAEAERKAWGRARMKALNEKLAAGHGARIWVAYKFTSDDEV